MWSSMIPIFDLDDTLYPEVDFVMSGFSAVAEWGMLEYGVEAKSSFEMLGLFFQEHGRTGVFDWWLEQVTGKRPSQKLVQRCVQVYRRHSPQIDLDVNTVQLLENLSSNNNLYLVTDGNKDVQNRKVDALGLRKYFRQVFITHRYGLAAAKPSLYCFDRIREIEEVAWADLLYIGDNPWKDFVSLNRVGAKTIRVLTGSYSSVCVSKDFDGQQSIRSLEFLGTLYPDFARVNE